MRLPEFVDAPGKALRNPRQKVLTAFGDLCRKELKKSPGANPFNNLGFIVQGDVGGNDAGQALRLRQLGNFWRSKETLCLFGPLQPRLEFIDRQGGGHVLGSVPLPGRYGKPSLDQLLNFCNQIEGNMMLFDIIVGAVKGGRPALISHPVVNRAQKHDLDAGKTGAVADFFDHFKSKEPGQSHVNDGNLRRVLIHEFQGGFTVMT
jgi:hypothetical protein